MEIDIGAVHEGARAILFGDPDQHRRGVGDGAEPLFALTGLVFRAGALDLGPGARRDFFDKADLGLGPVARRRRMDIEKRAQTSGPDQRRAHQSAGLDGVEGVGDRRRAKVLAHI